MASLLQVRNLRSVFHTAEGEITAVDDVSFDLEAGEVLGLVGESGSGKSVTALSLLRLITDPPGRIAGGEILFDGRDLLGLPQSEIQAIRGNEISMIFQEPMTSLNPIFSIGTQITEPLLLHKRIGRRKAIEIAIEFLILVGVPDPEQRMKEYPHQLSGGLRQRVMIAMALACSPKILIADEPTTALDVTIQAQILDLLRRLQSELGMAVIMITHDLGVIAEFADKVNVMYAGRIVESGPVGAIFERPAHPYTEALLASIPQLDDDAKRLEVIEGTVPNPFAMPPGCRFAPRCRYADPLCNAAVPPLAHVSDGQKSACVWTPNERLAR